MGDSLSQQDILDRMVRAVCTLYRHDGDLIQCRVNERSITHKLAEHMQPLFPRWDVDCEYNRRESRPKRLALDFGQIDPDDTVAKTVYPDIIVHRRGTKENLLVIEFKKADGESEEKDLEKLRAFQIDEAYRYKFGLFLRLGTKGCLCARVFLNTSEPSDCTMMFASALKELGYGG
jgi:hypothetical protein